MARDPRAQLLRKYSKNPVFCPIFHRFFHNNSTFNGFNRHIQNQRKKLSDPEYVSNRCHYFHFSSKNSPWSPTGMGQKLISLKCYFSAIIACSIHFAQRFGGLRVVCLC